MRMICCGLMPSTSPGPVSSSGFTTGCVAPVTVSDTVSLARLEVVAGAVISLAMPRRIQGRKA